jgi:hypothetical protein
MIENLADYLESEGVGTVGTDIFIGELPIDKNDCISLIYMPSPEPNKSVPYYSQTVDIRGRFSKFDRGYSKMKEIFDILHRKENYNDISGYHVYLSYAIGPIIDNDRDAQRRHLFQLSLIFVYRDSS